MAQKPKEGEPMIAFRLTPQKKAKLDKLLTSLDCTYGGKPSTGALVKKILEGEILLVKTTD